MTLEEYIAKKKKKKEEEVAEKVTEKVTKTSGTPTLAEYVASKGKKTTDEGWLKKGLFADGYQSGDLIKTIIGSSGDISRNTNKGMVGMIENAIDTTAYAVGGIGGLLGNDKLKEGAGKFVGLDLINEDEVVDSLGRKAPFSVIGNTSPVMNILTGTRDVEDASIWGNQADSLAQSGGQLAGTMALQSAGIPWWLTTGVTSFGGKTEEALNEGASYGKAGLSATITAGADILTEKLSGGIKFGGKTLDDVVLKPFIDKISNKTVRTLVNLGVDATDEGLEEVFASVFDRLGSALYKEENIKDLLLSEEAMDEYLNSFIGGALLGGGVSSVNAAKSIQTGRDYKTGLTDNEQKVVDAEVKSRIEEKETDGEKLTRKEKAEIEEQVRKDLEEGTLSTDTIEKTLLDEDSYKEYQSLKEQKKSLFEKMDSIQNDNSLTDTQKNVLIKAMNSEIETINNSSVQEKINKFAQDNAYLRESYNEQYRRQVDFDTTRYDAKQQGIVKEMVKDAKLNDTRKSHNIVDFALKMTSETNVPIKLVDSAYIEKNGKGKKGKIVNGYEENGKIYININSPRMLEQILGHETGHILKDTNADMYSKLQEELFLYAEMKGEFSSKLKATNKTYDGIDAEVDVELANDLIAEYLYSDEQFVKNLSTKQPNIFQKIYEQVKHWYKMATAGSEEQRQLEKIKRMYEKAYRELENTVVNGKTEYSLSTENIPYPKTNSTMSPTEANLQKDLRTVREVRTETMLKNNYTKEDVKQINKFMDNMATFMEKAGVTYQFIGLEDVNNAKLKVVYDKNGNPKRITMSAMVKNGDYPVNFDFTSICKKRQSMSMVVKELANRKNSDGKRTLDTINLDAKALWTINEELRKAGLETACLGCFVESKRYNIQKFSDKATSMWNSIVDEVRKEQGKTKPVEYFNFAEGVDLDNVDYNEVENIFKGYKQETGRKNPEGRMRALIKNGGEMFQRYLQPSDLMTPEGIAGMKSMSSKKNNFYGIIQGVYGTVAPKEVMGFTPYNSEIAMLPAKKRIDGKSTDIAKYITSIGGVRMQSFSDFIVSNVYDYMQMVADLSARHLPAHAYTKEIAFAKIFGLTGMKINMSVMFDIDANLPDEYAGLQFIPDSNGTEEYNGAKGRFEYLVADKKRSDSVYKETGERPYVQSIGYDEAVELQNTEGYSKNVGIIGVGFSNNHIYKMLDDNNIRYIIPYHASNMPTEIKEVTNIKKAKDYTDTQNTRDASGENLKGLGGFDIYKDVEETQNPRETANNYLEYCKERGYTPVFDEFAWHDNYYKLLFDFDVYDTITGEYSPQTEVKNIYKGYNAEEGLFSTSEIEKIIDEEMQVQNEANKHRNENISNVVDEVMKQLGIESNKVNFSLSESDTDTEGTTLTKEQQEYFKDSKAVDENGRLLKLYHGSRSSEAFNVFDTNMIGRNYSSPQLGKGFYFTTTKESAKKWAKGGKVYSVYLNMKKPFIVSDTMPVPQELLEIVESESNERTRELATESTAGFMTWFGAKEGLLQSYGYDGIILKADENSDFYKMYGDQYVVFDSNQIKKTTAKKPTSDADIRHSLSNEGEDIAPTGWGTYGKDIELEEAPVREQPIKPSSINNVAPVRDGLTVPYKNNRIGNVFSEADELDIALTDDLAEIDKIREYEQIAEILNETPKKESTRNKRIWAILSANLLDKGLVFENLALKSKGKDGKYNRELEAKWNYTLYSDARAQEFIGSGAEGVKSLNDIIAEVENTDHKKDFYQYMYHKHNIDRMNLRGRYKDKNGNPMNNKPVFGDAITSKVSKEIVEKYEKLYPEFKGFAQDVYDYMNHLRKLLVDNGVITRGTADLWSEMYPNYVPINRVDQKGLNVNVPLDTGRTGVNAPIKKATGGSSNILPLFDTMASRTMQTYKAIAKNSFGLELKNALGTVVSDSDTDVDDVIDSIDSQENLLQEGKNGQNPTFTVFENGKKVTFEVSKDMYDALKTLSESSILSKNIPAVGTISNIRRGLITEFNPVFMLTNPIKDVQDVLINSQHPVKTYKKIPEAFAQIKNKGYWYDEYVKNGGSQNTFFDNETGTFKTENKGLAKMLEKPPFSTISSLNQTIEMLPRLAEYIASREAGASVEVAMLDSARVTTNFRAGGDVTKFMNRNGFTFLNASVQGAMQQVRNVREAKANGLKGWVNLATKFAIAGLPAFILNHLMWDDDEEYEELSDYVKQNYYIMWKSDDGEFVRIPKGRMLAVIQDGLLQMENLITGNDEVDMASFLKLVVDNIAPANPMDNNILAPIIQTVNNKTWYGEDLVPTRLQDLPNAEQYDESTDLFSKWLGEKTDISPVKINYLIDQYSGGIGDMFLPMMTPEAESSSDSFAGDLIAPIKDKFTTDSVMNNQNVTDFYDMSEELTKKANSSKATDEDKLKSKYFNSMQSKVSELYKQKREIQNSNMKDSEKYETVKQIQNEIVSLCKKALQSYSNVSINNGYATVGDMSFKIDDEGNWSKVSSKQSEKQQEAMDSYGISGSEYWNNKDEYSFAIKYPEKYKVSQIVGTYDEYSQYAKALSSIGADKDASGKAINGSKKKKVVEYINSLNIDYKAKMILFKMQYPADNTYNNDIVEYIKGRNDISYEDKVTILKELGFTVTNGTVSW